MRPPRDMWMFGGVALLSLAGFLVLRPQPAPVVEPSEVTPSTVVEAPVVTAPVVTAPLLESLPESVSRVLADSGSAQVVDPDQLARLPESVVRVLIDRHAVLTLPEEP